MHENAFLHSKSAKAGVQGSLYVTIFALHKFFSDLLFKFLIDLLSLNLFLIGVFLPFIYVLIWGNL